MEKKHIYEDAFSSGEKKDVLNTVAKSQIQTAERLKSEYFEFHQNIWMKRSRVILHTFTDTDSMVGQLISLGKVDNIVIMGMDICSKKHALHTGLYISM